MSGRRLHAYSQEIFGKIYASLRELINEGTA
jgi:hypothetical protein